MKLVVVCDLHEEDWPSMDLVADELVAHARVAGVTVEALRPTIAPVLRAWLFGSSERPLRRKAGLATLRYAYYPALLRATATRADWFHIADHSYAHLARVLPFGRAGVYCHDVDAFRALWEPGATRLAKVLSARALAGVERARVVFYSTDAVRREIEEHRLVPSDRLVHAPYGIAEEFQVTATEEDREAAALAPYILHVGSLIPRKNPAFLLRLLQTLRVSVPGLRLIQVGGSWAPEERAALEAAGLQAAVIQRRGLSRRELAACYRNASAVVLPSLREGFGLPIVEALACGAAVVTSDLPVLRQVADDAVSYAPVNDMGAWNAVLKRVLNGEGPSRTRRLEIAARYSWERHAATIVGAYARLPSPG